MSIQQRLAALKPFFEPKSVAVIGASRTPGKGGANIVENLQRLGFPGRIYPVNPRPGAVLSLPSYPDVRAIPEAPDLALIVVPPGQVVKAVEDCIAAGVKAVIIESAGFGEMDSTGAAVEKSIARLARAAGVRVMGPNSVGTINTAARFDSSLGRLNETFLPQGDLHLGRAGLIGQTGLFTGVYLPLINEEIGISKVACLGNKCDVNESDMLEYLGEDAGTDIIGLYLESITEGRRFLALAREIVKKKPIIVLKSAVSAAGAAASASHTGALAGEDRVYAAAFRQAGVLRAGSFEQLWDVTGAFIRAPLPAGNRVGIINLAGSGCVLTADACARNGLAIAEISPATKGRIQKVFPAWWQVRSPVDVWTAIEASGFEAAYDTATRAVLEDAGVDAVVIVLGANNWLPGRDPSDLFAPICQDFPSKPIFAVTMLGDREIALGLRRRFLEIGIPCFTSEDAAIFTLGAMVKYASHRSKIKS